MYLRKVMHYLARCCQKLLNSWFTTEEALMALDSKWDQTSYTATTLRSLSNRTYDKDMEMLGMVDIAPELLAEMKRGSNAKQQFDTEAMQHVAEQMQLKPTDGANFSTINSCASVLLVTSHTTNGQESMRSVTTKTVEANLSQACQEFHLLTRTLREMSPEHSIFAEIIYTKNAMETGSFGSNQSEELKRMYRETRANSFRLRACINEVEQSTSMSKQQTGTPPPSGSAAPPPSPRAREPEGTREWGGAGIVVLNESATRVAGGGREEGNHNSLLWNGTTRRENASTGGGSPGACVGGQHGNQHTGDHNVQRHTGAGTRTATSQWERHQETVSERSEVEDDNRSWEEAAWEEINTTQRWTIGRIPNAERRTRTRQQDKLRDQQRASQ